MFKNSSDSIVNADSRQQIENGLDELSSSKKSYTPYPERKDLLSDYDYETDCDLISNEFGDDSIENKWNNARSSNLDKYYTKEFVDILKEEDFEFGYSSRSEEILEKQLKVNALATRNWLNEIFIKNYHDESILIGVLRIIGRFDSKIIFPQGQTIALAALTHSNNEIKELGIRAFEKWCSPESIRILKSLSIDSGWLNEYVQEVIKDLEEQLCLY